MKPFNLEEAKAGKPVVTRNGIPVRIICTDRRNTEFPIIALIDNGTQDVVMSYTKEGHSMPDSSSNNDLFMVPEKKYGWCNIYSYSGESKRFIGGGIYPSKEEAIASRVMSNDYIAVVKVEWEE